MNSPNHTPGPWSLLPARTLTNVKGPNGEQICQLGIKDANAPLIAAAPELMEIAKAYRNLLRTMAHTDGEVATYQHINEILAKITGGDK